MRYMLDYPLKGECVIGQKLTNGRTFRSRWLGVGHPPCIEPITIPNTISGAKVTE